MTLHPVTSICVSLSMTTQFLIYTPSLLSVYFLFLGSASAVSLSLLLLAFHSYIHILNCHWYNYALWVKFQPFSRSTHPTRHPHVDVPISLPFFPQHMQVNGVICLQMSKSEIWKPLFIQSVAALDQGVHLDYSNGFFILFSVFDFLPSSLILAADLFSVSLSIATVFSIICQLDSTLFLLPGLSFLSLCYYFHVKYSKPGSL